ncbi:MAG: acyloxyacyl hydrolase [Rickettsiales bacterium]|jgi:hypothetical protein|nr:acyloxyacyl hydrolase [Rickettsiales bacterium]
MQKIVLFIFIMMTLPICGAKANPMFGAGDDNSFILHIGHGTGDGTLFKLIYPGFWEFEPMTVLMAQYSQPMTIFRLPARQNIGLVQNFGYESDRGLSFTAFGISWDASLFDWRGFYIGLGLGPYLRDSKDWRVESRLVFGEKFFIGARLSNKWRAEFFTLHFSNGNLTPVNDGFNFTGISFNYSF